MLSVLARMSPRARRCPGEVVEERRSCGGEAISVRRVVVFERAGLREVEGPDSSSSP
jgi:hypothetical protein